MYVYNCTCIFADTEIYNELHVPVCIYANTEILLPTGRCWLLIVTITAGRRHDTPLSDPSELDTKWKWTLFLFFDRFPMISLLINITNTNIIWFLCAGQHVEVHFVTDQFQNIISPGFQWLTCSYLRHHTISVMHNVHSAVCMVHCKFSIFWYVWGLSAHCIKAIVTLLKIYQDI